MISSFEQPLGELKELDAFRLFKKKYCVEKHEGNGMTQIHIFNERDIFAVPTKTYILELVTNRKTTLDELSAGDT